jgi:tRNA/tmRNA/rRNA uracil-C5-methylase (TrmA/RlmC/RlmD family)
MPKPAPRWPFPQVMGGVKASFAPGSFAQANFGAMDAALAEIARHVPPGAAVADLHAGVGVIGLSLAATRGCRHAVSDICLSARGRRRHWAVAGSDEGLQTRSQ